ncbi:hypothetical protein AYO21_09774 [Fonsecaea monophora]|uniref:RING-type domain-containing protein n=1 Tax=Fonsecaea monophora TaxID=254056 RepID=A0A177EWR9_9EURO|nr:hypothetical protein AYO21_09774 [Fonsecaea monophora]OAG36056.1 hypothetical protein AYO21_09774 [Fonsecaea monophora]
MASSTLTTTASSTASPTGNPGGNGGSGPSSPLLFFVALGFGVVFTNLWIIVGVKYCFRYNQRNRQRMNGEDPDGVDLAAMPRQHRRRREKKLMTIEEVNEKFPLTKYKTWRSNRADEGLPTAGGITTASRPASIHNAQRDSKESKEMEAQELAHAQTNTSSEEKTPEHGEPELVEAEKSDTENRPVTPSRPKSSPSTVTPGTPVHKVTSHDDEDEDEERIQTALPPEQLPDPGDACAICIDNIDDDDDIPDYYVPKPRPEGAEVHPTNLQPPPTAFSIIGNGRPGRRPAMIIPGRFMSIVYHDRDRHGFPLVVRAERTDQSNREQSRRQQGDRLPSSNTAAGHEGVDTPSSRRPRFGFRIPGLSRPAQTQTAAPEALPTPSQLEAGR